MMAIEDIEPSKFVNAYEVDSPVVVELRKPTSREIETDMNVFDILGNALVTVLSGKTAAKSGFVSAAGGVGLICKMVRAHKSLIFL